MITRIGEWRILPIYARVSTSGSSASTLTPDPCDWLS